MSNQDECIFCKIVAGEIPCFRVYEDDDTLAFMDINPANEGHALVIPKEHGADVHAISDADRSSNTSRIVSSFNSLNTSPRCASLSTNSNTVRCSCEVLRCMMTRAISAGCSLVIRLATFVMAPRLSKRRTDCNTTLKRRWRPLSLGEGFNGVDSFV